MFGKRRQANICAFRVFIRITELYPYFYQIYSIMSLFLSYQRVPGSLIKQFMQHKLFNNAFNNSDNTLLKQHMYIQYTVFWVFWKENISPRVLTNIFVSQLLTSCVEEATIIFGVSSEARGGPKSSMQSSRRRPSSASLDSTIYYKLCNCFQH